MKKILLTTLLSAGLSLALVSCGESAKEKSGDSSTPSDKAQYSCPMHPEVISDKPGQCPKCGMDLVKK